MGDEAQPGEQSQSSRRPKWDRFELLDSGTRRNEQVPADPERIGIERLRAVHATGQPFSPSFANVVLIVPVTALFVGEVSAWLAWQPVRLLRRKR